ncbi:MAG TPA: hypothetical protein VH333_00100 [Pseudonocardiaceae bacterium]|nr:hypothetical protein [Pseudonocardiaceae bacterium]
MIPVLLTVAGVAVLLAVWASVLHTLLPSQAPPRAARWSARWVTLAVTPLGRRLSRAPRERVMALAAPLGLFLMLSSWLLGIGIGCVLLAAGIAGTGVVSEELGRFFALDTTGATQIIGVVWWLSAISVVGAFVAYLVAVTNAYGRRELLAARLSARAARPPDAERILATYIRSGRRDELDDLFAEWTGWLADVRCSHVNYPSLVYIRPASELCWLQAAVIMLDAAALLEAIAPSWALPFTQALLDTGIRCVERMGADLDIRLATQTVSLQGREQFGFDDTTRVTTAAGLPAERSPREAWQIFQDMRTRYAPLATAMAQSLLHDMVDARSAPFADATVRGEK